MGSAPAPAPSSEPQKPSFTWYEHLWMGWPLLLVFVGGLIGGLCGGLAWGINQAIFKTTRSTPAKYLLSGLVSVGAVIAYVVLAVLVLSAVGK